MSKLNRRSFIAMAGTATVGVATNGTTITKKKNSIIHHVFFWLNNPRSEEDRKLLMAGLKTLKKIKPVRQLYIGVPAATEKREVIESGYDVSELIFFDDLAGQKAYQDDPIHLRFIKDYGHLWKKVVVYDVQQLD